ncbi:MAG: PspC domain-containing protein [Sphaerochaetaceae bacterium]
MTSRLYRSNKGEILGVFQGLASWSGINVWILRVIGIVIAFKIGFVPSIIIYLLGAVLMPRY